MCVLYIVFDMWYLLSRALKPRSSYMARAESNSPKGGGVCGGVDREPWKGENGGREDLERARLQ